MELAQADIEQDLPNNADAATLARKVTAFYDNVGIPAMRLFSSLHNDVATAEHRLRINTGLKQFSQEMADEYPIPSGPSHDYPRVLCVAARWEVDSKAADMLAHSLQLQSYATQTWASPLLLQLDSIDQVWWQDFDVVCISVFNPQPSAALRLLCRHIRKRWPNLRIMVAAWNADAAKISANLPERYGVDGVVDNMQALGLHLDKLRQQNTEDTTHQPLPSNESERLTSLHNSHVLDADWLPLYQERIQQARSAFDTAYAQISWVDADWVYTPASTLLPLEAQTAEAGLPREHTVCQYLVQQNDVLVIEDTTRDPRFADQQEFDHQKVRFYAGVPLRDEAGMVLGSLCVMDDKPRDISAEDLEVLQNMADELMQHLQEQNSSKD